MRVVGGTGLVLRAVLVLREGTPVESALPPLFAAGGGALLAAGLWTPLAGVLVAVIELWAAAAGTNDMWAGILMGTLGVALALLGPGAWSVDARLFGWKRIGARDRQS